MTALRAFLFRMAGLFDRERRERELAEELECHLQMEMEANRRARMTPAEARRAALVKSGGMTVAEEACRERRGPPVLEAALRDLRHALRLLARSPAFTLVVMLSLGLGIGANTAIFTLLDQIVLRPLPVRHPEQLEMIWTTGPNLGNNQGSRAASYPMYQDFQRGAPAFSYVFCRHYTPLSISMENQTERVMGELVSGNYFQALGIGPALGRVFSPEEDDRIYKGHPVVVLSHQYWVTRFGADPAVLGRKMLVNNYPMVVVGVSAAGFSGLDPARSPQVRIPIQMKPLMTPGSDNLGDRRRQWIQIFARRKPGYTLESAQASLQPLLGSILRAELESPALRDRPKRDRDQFLARRVLTESAASGYTSLPTSYSRALVVLMCMVGLVLLIACFNVASLLIARAATRQKELAVRLAIGASRGQLLRQLLVESAVLSIAGAALGLAFSVAMVHGLLGFLPANGMLATLRAEPDWRILAFNSALAIATSLLVGLAPACQALKTELWSTLQSAGSVSGGRGAVTLRKTLVTAQVAFSFLLVSGALLFGRTLLNLKGTNSGFHDIDNVVSFQIDPARGGYSLPRLKEFYRQALENVRAIAEVKSAGYAWVPVLSGREADWDVVVEGRPRDDRDIQAFINGLSPGYWRTMGVMLLDGRDFNDGDVAGRPKVAIVNRKFARHFFGEQSPIGRRITLETSRTAMPDTEIVGLVEDSLYEGPRQGVRRQVFFPLEQMNQSVGVTFYARTVGDSAALFPALRRKIMELDPTMPIFEIKTLDAQLDETLGTERLSATLSAAFGGLATLLAAVGLYGVMALTVARRTREFGLRMALGERRGALLWMVLREAFGLLGLGLAVGIPCAYLLSRVLGSQLLGVVPADPGTAAVASMVLVAVAACAALVPARRASRIDPIQALRHE